MNNSKFSFKKGYYSLPARELNDVRAEICNALNVRSRQVWWNRLAGNVEPKISEAKKIEEIFLKHGIKDVWGE